MRDDGAERVLASAFEQGESRARTLFSLGGTRRTHVANGFAGRRDERERDRESMRRCVRSELEALIAEMRSWLDTAGSGQTAPFSSSVLEWLVHLPRALRENEACRDSVVLSDDDVKWLVRKAASTLAVLLAEEDAQRSYAVRKGVADEEMEGFLERLGCLREGCVPLAANDWLGAFARERMPEKDAAEALFALFLYTANCRSRSTVQGWEDCGDDEWEPAPAPRNTAVHGPNASPWAVMNWTLRASYDARLDKGVRSGASQSRAPFEFLRDRIDEALLVLPKERDVVFRGVDIPGLSYRYSLGHPVVFPPFTSTSTQGEEARSYAKRDGTFFIIRSHSAARIDFVSFVPAEAEKLLPSFSCFSVLQRASNTVLRMLECPYDIVTLSEHGDYACTDLDAVNGYLRSVRQTRFIFERYLTDTYIEGTVGPLPPPCATTTPLYARVEQWLSGNGHLLLLGTGGCGKTSAVLAAHSLLSADDRAAPVLVPLPTVKNVFAAGAIDAHVADMLCLTHAQMEVLSNTRTLVLLLESLDEVVVPPGADVRSGVLSLLPNNPLTARARVLLSARDEFLSRHNIEPRDVFGDRGDVVYVQPFSPDDIEAFVDKQCARESLSAEEKREAIGALCEGLLDALKIPCVLHMACRVDVARLKAIVEASGGHVRSQPIYEAYLDEAMCGTGDADGAGLRAMETLALTMLDANEWHVTVGRVAEVFEMAGIDRDTFRARYLPHIPCRVESDADDGGLFAWWHKSIGEYLAARAFVSVPVDSLALVRRPFSLDTPAVLQYVADIAAAEPDGCDAVCRDVLIPAVHRSRDSDDPHVLAAASNAMALVCAASHLVHRYDLAGVVIDSANLEGALLYHARLRGATLRRCRLDMATFNDSDVTDAKFPDSTCELVLAPMHHVYADGSAYVTCVAFSPDGKALATASVDHTLRLWEVATGQLVRQLKGHSDTAYSVAFSPDGVLLMSGSKDKSVRMWSVDTGEQLGAQHFNVGEVRCVCFSPDGRHVAVGGDVACIVPVEGTKVKAKALSGHDGAVRSVCFSPDGAFLASGSVDTTVGVWDAATGASVAQLKGHSRIINCVTFSRDGRRLGSASNDGTARVWDTRTWSVLFVLRGHTGNVLSVAFSPNGALLATGASDTSVRLWEAVAGNEIRVLEGHDRAVNSVAFSPDSRRVASGSDDDTALLSDVTVVGRRLHVRQGARRGVYSLCFSPSGNVLAVVSVGSVIYLYDGRSGQERTTFDAEGSVYVVCYARDASLFAAGSRDGKVRLWDVATGRRVHLFEGMGQGAVVSVAISPNGKMVASAARGPTVELWDAESGAHVRTLTGHKHSLNSVAFSPDGARLVSGAHDETVRVWDVETCEQVRCIKGHSGGVECVVFSPAKTSSRARRLTTPCGCGTHARTSSCTS